MSFVGGAGVHPAYAFMGGSLGMPLTLGKLPASTAGEHRALKDTALLKEIRRNSQTDMTGLLDRLDPELIRKIMTKRDVIDFISENGRRNVLPAQSGL